MLRLRFAISWLLPVVLFCQIGSAQTVRFHTNLGDMDVAMLTDRPLSVANFLNYMKRGAYDNSVIHRSVKGFIIQGGGFKFQGGNLPAILQDAAVRNEPGVSNIRGTIGMAKLGSDANSATNQWFFNLADNSSNLNGQNGGFTVFGRITDSAGLAVMDRIAAVPVPSPAILASPFDAMPLINYRGGSLTAANLVMVLSMEILGDPLQPSPPTINSLAASPLSGASTTITVAVGDNAGYPNLGVINLLVNNFLDGRNACYVAVVPLGNTATVYLVNDVGDAGGPYTSLVIPGSSGQASNSQCTITAAGSSFSFSGNLMTVSLKMTFTTSFAGAKVIYAAARDLAGQNTGWQSAGTFFVGVPTFSVNPSAGIGTSQTFSFTLTPPSGGSWTNSNPVVNVLLNSALDGASACYMAFLPASQTLYLVNDVGTNLLPNSLNFPSSATINNSQCTIAGNSSSWAVTAINQGVLTVGLTFTSAFKGDRIFYVAVRNDASNSGWQATGSWVAP